MRRGSAGGRSPFYFRPRVPFLLHVTRRSRIRIAIVGLNFGAQIVRHLLHGPASRWFEVVAVSDLDARRAAEVAMRHGLRVAGWDELLDDASIAAVGLFTGPAGRAGLIQAAVRAGKDVLTTKPFELSTSAASAVLAEAEARGRVVHLNSPPPRPPRDLAQIDRWRDRHRLGRLVGLRAEAWGPYQETADGSWYDDPERCPVAPIFRLGIYLINDVVHLAGAPVALQVVQSRVRTGRPTPDNATVTLVFPDGAIASLYASLCVDDGQPYKNSLAVNFERGSVYRNCGAPDLLGGDIRAELSLVRPSRRGQPRVLRRASPFLSGDYAWSDFALAVRTRAPMPATARQTLLTGLRVISALPAAARTGNLTPID